MLSGVSVWLVPADGAEVSDSTCLIMTKLVVLGSLSSAEMEWLLLFWLVATEEDSVAHHFLEK
jgi:hypothetical protein